MTGHSFDGYPSWKSHKVVRAAPIEVVYVDKPLEDPDAVRTLTMRISQTPDITDTYAAHVKHALWARYVPVVGDYLVVYDDGYFSLSPKKAFEDGYSRVAE